jgi:hypothetical protein
MNEDEERVPLSEQDIALLREIARWRQANGVNYFQWRPGVGFGAFTEWYRREGKRRADVSYDPRSRTVTVTRDYYGDGRLPVLPTGTVTETIDCLVALDYLPSRFSSAYRRGWDARLNVDATARELGEWDALHYASDKLPAVKAAW